MLFVQKRRETIDHILLHCSRQLCYDNKRKKVWKATPLCFSQSIWKKKEKKEIREFFYNFEKANQTIKQSFLCNFLEWIRVYIGDGSLSMLDFIDWPSSK